MDQPAIDVVSEPDPLERLRAGNARLVEDISKSGQAETVRPTLSVANPYAIVLGCSDSRVPPEIVFDETFGQLFVVRVASNLAGPNEIGSIEYALARWSCPLLVVLGHTECGGIGAAMDQLPSGAEPAPSLLNAMHMAGLVFNIKSTLGPTRDCAEAPDPWAAAVEQNVRRTLEMLANWSDPIRSRVADGSLRLVGAIYDVTTGEVRFLS